MIKEIIDKWDANKSKLEQYFRENNQDKYDNYSEIVKLIFELVINDDNLSFNVEKLHVIDDGDYQGTQIFIIPICIYQPIVSDYIITDTYYGSCSGCDTLLNISGYEDGLPTDIQVKAYMALALHIVQKMKWLNDNQ